MRVNGSRLAALLQIAMKRIAIAAIAAIAAMTFVASTDAQERPPSFVDVATMVPGLAAAARVDSLTDVNERGFLTAQLRRQVNRFQDTLERAIAEVS